MNKLDELGNKPNFIEIINRRKQRNSESKVEAFVIPQKENKSNVSQVSFAQQRLYFLDQFEKNSSAYNIGGTLILKGPLDRNILEKSIKYLSQRHETLRSTFALIDSKVMQISHEDISIPIDYEDLCNIEQSKKEEYATKLISNKFSMPFDLATGPLIRVVLVRIEKDFHYMCLCMHHIISDNKSIQIFLDELAVVYRQQLLGMEVALPELTIQYSDFSEWQRSESREAIFDKQINYWVDEFTNISHLLELPFDSKRPSMRTSAGSTFIAKRSLEIKNAIEEISKKNNVSPYMTMMAAFQLFLYKHSGQKGFAVGTPVTARKQHETLGIIGVFADTMAITSNFEKDIVFQDLIIQVRDKVLNGTANSDIPFDKVVDAVHPDRSTSYTPLFQTMFVFHHEQTPFQLPNIEVSNKEFETSSAKFDITLTVVDTPSGFEERWEYSTELFEKATIELFAKRFGTLLRLIIDNPNENISNLLVMNDEELDNLLLKRNNTFVNYDLTKSLYGYIEEQVKRNSNKVAIKFKSQSLTYSELDILSNKLANKLLEIGVSKGDFVSICMYRSPALIVALLGTIKCGAVYVPIDPDYPEDRISYLMNDSASNVVIVDDVTSEIIDNTNAYKLVLDKDWSSIESYSDERYCYEFDSFDNCYMIYTSGSTGQPKGAIIHHAAVVNRLLWMRDDYNLAENDIFLQKTPFSFDVSVWELFLPLIIGAKLVIAEPGKHKDTTYLRDIINIEQVSVIHFVPSMLEAFLNEAAIEKTTSLRNVFCSGEALSRKTVNKFYNILQHSRLINLYGPTETAVDVSAWVCEPDVSTAAVPIGFPVANTKIYIVDEYLKPVPQGVPGELIIGGVQVGKGYHNKPELSKERFLENMLSKDRFKLYRTGDLARYRFDGAIEFLGRNDNQVKIRGFRIELGEIEQTINQCPFVENSVVKAVDNNGAKVIVAYVKHTDGDEKELKITLKHELSKNLPEYMVPSFFIFLDTFPLSPNGKIDIKRLPSIDMSISAELTEIKQPSTEIENRLCEVFKDVLSIPRIGVNNSFFDVGGDSIVALQIVAKAKGVGVLFQVSDIFKYQTIEEIALHSMLISSEQCSFSSCVPFSLISDKDKKELPEGAVDAYPLSILQQGMIYHSEYIKDNSTYHDVFSYHIEAHPNFELFKKAFYKTVDRHPILRTMVDLSNYSEPLQIVFNETKDLFGEDIDISNIPFQEQNDFIKDFIDIEKNRKFQLESTQLIRVFLAKREENSFQVTLSFHHAILDGWSIGKMLTEILENYSDLLKNQEVRTRSNLASNYADFIKKEIEETQDKTLSDFFREYLEDMEVSTLPSSNKLAASANIDLGMKTEPINISQNTFEKLQQVAGELGVPLKTLLMTAHVRALGVACGTQDVVTGFVTHGRLESSDGENVLGLFLNSLPIRVKLKNESYRDLILRVFDNEINLVKGRRFPYAQILSICKKEKLFDTIFNFTNYHDSSTKLDDLSNVKIIDQAYYEKTNFELMASFSLNSESNNLLAFLRYHPEAYDEHKIRLLAGYYERILSDIANNCGKDLSSCSVLSEKESEELLSKFNATETPYDLTHTLHYWFEEQVKRTPDSIALKFGDLTMTYEELNCRANKIAHFLIENGVKPNDFVGISLNRSFTMFEGIYGILKSGAAYVPIDPTYPEGRIQHMIDDSKVKLLLCDSVSVLTLPKKDIVVICLDSQCDEFDDKPDTNPIIDVGSENFAYMIYTSGSTGKPKGAINRHGAICNFMLWMNDNYKLTSEDCVLHKTPFSFDVSLCEIFHPLISGAKVVIAEPEGHKDTTYLIKVIKNEKVTLVHFVPSMLQLFIEEPEINNIDSLKYVICIGEALTKELEREFYEKMNCQLSNLYGPAETAVVVTSWNCDPKDGVSYVPIGKPVANTQIYIVDSMLNLVPKGVPGEILIGGQQVGAGYFERPELTSERFIDDIFSNNGRMIYRTGDLGRYNEKGELEFIGRIDHQVKINGLRIELGEIEESLRSHPAIRDAFVSVYKNNIGLDSLGAHIWVRENNADITEDEIIKHISNTLPLYMIPAQILILDKFPLNPSGKVDRKALPQFSAFKAMNLVEMVRPQNELEEAIHDVLCEVLGVEEISVIGNLMDYGMGSLSAIRIVSKLRNTLGIEVELSALFDLKTISAISDNLLSTFIEEVAISEEEEF